MTSQARVSANRRNAEKSTGPRTQQGKAIVAQNALKHGLRARHDVVMGEDPQEFALCRDRLLGELTPVGEMETILAEQIVSLAWRLRRAQRFQNQLFDYLLAKELEDSLDGFDDMLSEEEVEEMTRDPRTDPHLAIGRVLDRDYSRERVLDRLQMYEQRIANALYKAMSSLWLARKQGPGGVCGVPARASHVAQPPSAGITAEGGGATCATANGMDSVEQSQRPPAEGGPELPLSHRQSFDKLRRGAALDDATHSGCPQESVKQSQPAVTDPSACQTKPAETAEAGCAKQSQFPAQAQSLPVETQYLASPPAEAKPQAPTTEPVALPCQTNPTEAAGSVCSVPETVGAGFKPARTASEETPHGVTTNRVESAKQSHSPAAGGSGEVADHAKQS